MSNKSSIDASEIAKFAQLANDWWDLDGPLKTLHDINPARLELVKKHINLKDKQVLDLGCGGGIFSEAMAKLGAHVTGLDAEAEAITTAQNHARAHDFAIQYVSESVELFSHEPFDVVTCMEMLEHVADPQLILEHASRLMKPGGLLFLSTINRTIKAYATVILAAEYLLQLLPRQTHAYAKFIKPSELSRMARKAGFELLEVMGLHYDPLTRKAALRKSVSVNYFLVLRKRSP